MFFDFKISKRSRIQKLLVLATMLNINKLDIDIPITGCSLKLIYRNNQSSVEIKQILNKITNTIKDDVHIFHNRTHTNSPSKSLLYVFKIVSKRKKQFLISLKFN